ncbi:hypothetical protein M271_39915 [Streptomyces rapamycinicus NRRL 5491]|nr:hypothetical protein M271_39915 [Streptomyces rapamycinicus NRRL 5491]
MGVLPGSLGERLQHVRGIPVGQGFDHAGRVRESLGCGECPVSRIPGALAPSLQHKGCYRGGDEQDNEYDL